MDREWIESLYEKAKRGILNAEYREIDRGMMEMIVDLNERIQKLEKALSNPTRNYLRIANGFDPIKNEDYPEGTREDLRDSIYNSK